MRSTHLRQGSGTVIELSKDSDKEAHEYGDLGRLNEEGHSFPFGKQLGTLVGANHQEHHYQDLITKFFLNM